MLHDWLTRYPGWLLLALQLVGGCALAMPLVAIVERVDPRHRAKLNVLITGVFSTIVFMPSIVLYPGHWMTSVTTVVTLTLTWGSRDYFFRNSPFWLPWCLGVISLVAAATFGVATVRAAQNHDQIALNLAACAITALFSGFCFGFLVARWRDAQAAARATRPPIEPDGAQI